MAIGERGVKHPISVKELGLIGTAAVTIGGLAIGGSMLFGRDRGPQNPPSEPVKASDPLRPNEPAQAVLPINTRIAQVELTPTTVPTPTETPSTPTPEPATTSTPEAEQTIQNICGIVPEQFCSQAEVIDWTNPSGKKMRVIGFNLPAGVPLFMPIDGQVTKAKLPEGGAIKGFKATVFDPSGQNSFRYNFYGDLGFENMFSLNKKTSEAFGFTQQTGIENAGNYNVIFAIEQGSGREATIVEDELRKMFPGAFNKPPKLATAPEGSIPGTIYTDIYLKASQK